MITTVTLNAAIDKTYFLPQFQMGVVTRVDDMIVTPGGKGINSARVIHQLGQHVTATGFVGGNNGHYIQSELQGTGIECDFVEVKGESRLCLNMINVSDQSSTELLEPGPLISDTNILSMKEKIRKLSKVSKIVSFSGSLPRGVSSQFYCELIEIAQAEGARVFLDTSGTALVEGIKAKPFLIKPNETEIETLISRKLNQEKDLYENVLQLMQTGIDCVVVSLGSKGAIVGYEGELMKITAPKIVAVNTVGCGDSFIAGMAYATSMQLNTIESLQFATAVGTANALTQQPGWIQREDVERLLPQVHVETILSN